MMEEAYVPIGFRFSPTDEELIHYLWVKNNRLVLPCYEIKEYNVYSCNPDQLSRDFSHGMSNELYFFTTKEREYLKGKWPSRMGGDGYWKSTSIEQEIQDTNKSIIGYKKTLAYHYKENRKKSSCIMHEYRIHKNDKSKDKKSLKVDGFVICRII